MPKAPGSEAGPAGSILQTPTSTPSAAPKRAGGGHVKPSSSNYKAKRKLSCPDSGQMGKLRLRNLYMLIVFVATLRGRVGPASPTQQLRNSIPSPSPSLPLYPSSFPISSVIPQPLPLPLGGADLSPRLKRDCSSQVTQPLPALTHAGTPSLPVQGQGALGLSGLS